MKKIATLLMVLVVLTTSSFTEAAEPLKIGYSDYPGWIAWDIAIKKGWFQEEGVNVEFSWMEYAESMDAFAAGKVDGVTMTNGDALVTQASGAPNVIIMTSDYSNGNDMVVTKSGISSIADLKGKVIGVEIGLVDHLLLLSALEEHDMTQDDVEIVNILTHEAPQTLASGKVDAIAAWQPNSGKALKAVAGSSAIFTSENAPGLIYDCLAVSPATLNARKDDWQKVVKVWYRVVDFINDPANQKEALEIMSSRVGLSPEEFGGFMKGTYFLTLDEAKSIYAKGDDFTSIYGSSKIADEFNISNNIYDVAQDIEANIDPSLTLNLK